LINKTTGEMRSKDNI